MYQGAVPGSRAFQTRLIELVVVSIHQIAAKLYNLHADGGLHKGNEMLTWTPPKDDEVWWEVNPGGAPPTLFRHRWYCDYDQYPEGIADSVGYWAEARIFGGIVMFDRRPAGSAPNVDVRYHQLIKAVGY